MYQGVLGKLQLLHPGMIAEEKVGGGYERMRKEMEKEVGRRRALASQLQTLLDNQLEVACKSKHTVCEDTHTFTYSDFTVIRHNECLEIINAQKQTHFFELFVFTKKLPKEGLDSSLSCQYFI